VLAAADIRGGGPGTRETDLLHPSCMVDRIDAICLSGGSVFGLRAADGVIDWLAERGRGLSVHGLKVPIVPGAIIFDLASGGGDGIVAAPPYIELAQQACAAARPDFALGSVGAGTGARAGRMKGGLGSASITASDGLIVAALVVANPVGAVTMPDLGTFWAWGLEQNGELGRQHAPARTPAPAPDIPSEARIGGNTTLGVVATNAALDKADAQRVAMMAHDGFARAIRPVHTPFDGDSIFVISTGDHGAGERSATTVARIGSMAADCVARAVCRGVFEADALDDIPAYRTLHGEAFG
jgi:L-aminopeptidase/D-esterase-like protein